MRTMQWRMKRRTPFLKPDDYELRELTLDDPPPGHVLVAVRFLPLDPYLATAMQTWSSAGHEWEDGVIRGRLVAQVEKSNSERFSQGDHVLGYGRWQSHEVLDASRLEHAPTGPGVAPRLGVGILGSSGMTAWIGIHLTDPQPGQTVFVSAATGAVGSVAGQLAKRRGCRVVGLAGGREKCDQAVRVLGFDACVDYREPDLDKQVADAAPSGIDVLFENVGAPSMGACMPSMVWHGRILLCGLTAHYNSPEPVAMANFRDLLYRQVTVTPIALPEHQELFAPAREELHRLVAEGSLRYSETVIPGFENAPAAFLDMLSGKGIGKRLVQINSS